MIRFTTELVGEHLLREASVLFTEVLAKLNARKFARERRDDSPCCARCAGCELDTSAALADADRLLEARKGHPVSIVAYSMGKELAAGRSCRAVVIDGDRLAYQRDDDAVIDPVGKYQRNEECCCGQASEHEHPAPADAGAPREQLGDRPTAS